MSEHVAPVGEGHGGKAPEPGGVIRQAPVIVCGADDDGAPWHRVRAAPGEANAVVVLSRQERFQRLDLGTVVAGERGRLDDHAALPGRGQHLGVGTVIEVVVEPLTAVLGREQGRQNMRLADPLPPDQHGHDVELCAGLEGTMHGAPEQVSGGPPRQLAFLGTEHVMEEKLDALGAVPFPE